MFIFRHISKYPFEPNKLSATVASGDNSTSAVNVAAASCTVIIANPAADNSLMDFLLFSRPKGKKVKKIP